MSELTAKPRWRWATRDRFAIGRGAGTRFLWTCRPLRRKVNARGMRRDMWTQRRGRFIEVSAAYCIHRFGRDLPPGKIRRLP